MSKKLKNYTDPMLLMDQYSTDSFRFLMLSSPLTNGENFNLADKDVAEVARKLSMIWNMYDFFTMYAEVDSWEFDGKISDPLKELKNPLDIWVVSRLHQLVSEVEERTEGYDLQAALRPILPFIDDASNWYVRRSRRRFWKSEDDEDKSLAYKTLHYVLLRLAYLLAPFAPYMAEELHANLTGDPESIHLKLWLPAGEIDNNVMTEMDEVRGFVNQGLSLRSKAGIKVRQPLQSVTVPNLGSYVDYSSILTEELNVKNILKGNEVAIDENITPELRQEGLVREVLRQVQESRKTAGLDVDDRIRLSLSADGEIGDAILAFADLIEKETLVAKALEADITSPSFDQEVEIEGKKVTIKLSKA